MVVRSPTEASRDLQRGSRAGRMGSLMLSKRLPKNSVLICFLAYTRQRARITLQLSPVSG